MKTYFSNCRHPFLFLLTELSSQARGRSSSVSPEILDIQGENLYTKSQNLGLWFPLAGPTTVGVENGTIIGKIVSGRLVPIYNDNSIVINIRLLGSRRIQLSQEEVRRLPFGRAFRRTMVVKFVM